MVKKEEYYYQNTGAKFLASKKCALLADEMGLGKTIQAIMAADKVEAKNILVISPKSVISNWQVSFKDWQEISREINVVKNSKSKFKSGVNILTYGLTIQQTIQKELLARRWDLIILDESDYLKNPDAKRTKSIYGKRNTMGIVQTADRVWCLTGTPVRNHAGELYPMLRSLAPDLIKIKGVSTPYWTFLNYYARVVQTHFGHQIIGHSAKITELRNKLEDGFMLRRMKKDVLKDLPPLRYGKLNIEPDIYAKEYRELEEFVDEDLTQLLESGRFTNVVDGPLPTIRRLTETLKVPGVVETVKEELEGGKEKILIFAQHISSISKLYSGLADYNPVAITGSTSQDNRSANINEFQNGKSRVFIGQIIAAGAGITLHANGKCSDAIFTSLDFVPAINQQAAMRIHRIGQPNSCLVRVATLAGSIDETVSNILIRKISMIEDLMEVGSVYDAA